MFFYNDKAGVSFINPDNESDIIHTSDFNLIYQTANLPTATPKTQTIDVPYRDGVIDLTDSNGKEFVRYNSRSIEITLVDLDYASNFDQKFNKLKRAIHGKRKKIILDCDPSFYYLGRIISFSDIERGSTAGTVVITAEVDPFKYSIHNNSDKWLWDPFCFETDVIPNGANIKVNGTTKVTFFTGDQTVIPTINATGTVSMKLRSETFSLKAGAQKNRDIIFYSGENEVTFTGNGTVTVDYERKFF